MKIVICGSMAFSGKMVEIANKLKQAGHKAVLPRNTENYAARSLKEEIGSESTENKIKHNLIREYYNEIKNSDAVLIVNEDKNNIPNYIGGNSFLEMGFAHVLNKKIFILNSLPEMIYTDEIKAMQPVILEGDLDKIKKA
ncbi:MAG: hypothetical protein WC619_01730 [Patescibacteria group bacterium]